MHSFDVSQLPHMSNRKQRVPRRKQERPHVQPEPVESEPFDDTTLLPDWGAAAIIERVQAAVHVYILWIVALVLPGAADLGFWTAMWTHSKSKTVLSHVLYTALLLVTWRVLARILGVARHMANAKQPGFDGRVVWLHTLLVLLVFSRTQAIVQFAMVRDALISWAAGVTCLLIPMMITVATGDRHDQEHGWPELMRRRGTWRLVLVLHSHILFGVSMYIASLQPTTDKTDVLRLKESPLEAVFVPFANAALRAAVLWSSLRIDGIYLPWALAELRRALGGGAGAPP